MSDMNRDEKRFLGKGKRSTRFGNPPVHTPSTPLFMKPGTPYTHCLYVYWISPRFLSANRGDPANSFVDPGNVRAHPANLSPHPANFLVDPGNVSTDPANLSPDPANVSTDPANLSPDPANVSTDPANLSIDPANVSTAPANLSPDPGNVSFDPGNFSVNTGNLSTIHGNFPADSRIPIVPTPGTAKITIFHTDTFKKFIYYSGKPCLKEAIAIDKPTAVWTRCR